MAGKTYWQQDKTLSLLTSNVLAAGTPLTYVNLFTANPASDNNATGGTLGTEWTGNGTDRIRVYSTVQVSNPYWVGPLSESNKRYLTNVNEISWTYTQAGAQQIVVGIGVWDSDTSGTGNLRYWEPLDTTRTIVTGQEFVLPTYGLKVRED